MKKLYVMDSISWKGMINSFAHFSLQFEIAAQTNIVTDKPLLRHFLDILF